MKSFQYYYSKFFKVFLRGKSINNCVIDQSAVIFSGCNLYDSSVGRHTYIGYDCNIGRCKIGNFCSISDFVYIGGGEHPIEWVSTSPTFQDRSHGPRVRRFKHLAEFETSEPKETVIGNDVWIGHGVSIKQGIKVGDGAVIGTGAVVTKDVPPYAIVAGVPAKIIKHRFSKDTIDELLNIKWWEYEDKEIEKYSMNIKTPEVFIRTINEQKNHIR